MDQQQATLAQPKITSKSLSELEIDDAEYQIVRQRLIAEKQALQGQLAELNAKCAVRLAQSEYQRIQRQRVQLVKMLADKESEIGESNSRRAELTAVRQVRGRQTMGRSEIRQLVAIRDRWHDFSMDSGNHQKAREAAWKMSQELREILKQYFDSTSSMEQR